MKRFVAAFANGDCVAMDEQSVANLLSFSNDVESYSLLYNDNGRILPACIGPVDWGSNTEPNVAVYGSAKILSLGRVVGHVNIPEQ